MSAKDNAKLGEETGGQLKYIKTYQLTIGDTGAGGDENIDFSLLTFESGSKCSHIQIANTGLKTLYVVYDALGSTIDTAVINPFPGDIVTTLQNKIRDGEAGSIGFRCASGETTTIVLTVW